MKMASVREFRHNLPAFTRQGGAVLVTNHGRMVGCFLPMEDTSGLPVELKKEFVAAMGRTIAKELAGRHIAEKDVLDDFRQFKKTRRRQ